MIQKVYFEATTVTLKAELKSILMWQMTLVGIRKGLKEEMPKLYL